jgi:hypothetical protein
MLIAKISKRHCNIIEAWVVELTGSGRFIRDTERVFRDGSLAEEVIRDC